MKNQIFPYQVVLFEGNGAKPLTNETRRELTGALLDRGYSVLRISDSNLAPRNHEVVPMLVLGNFEGQKLEINSSVEIKIEDVTGLSSENILELIDQQRETDDDGLNTPGEKGAWKPWFPVIDFDRCTNCMQCLSFCLFDVYGVDDDKQIQVQNNDNCKTNCPACSRVCPEVAIMFPKYSGGPINGAEVADSDLEREKMKVDITSLLGGDIYASLRTRSEKAKSRFSKERSPDKALNERKRCLTKLQQSGIIPAEVLAELDLESLPSPDEIKRKAEELAKKMAEE